VGVERREGARDISDNAGLTWGVEVRVNVWRIFRPLTESMFI
jgi:hypothetical protein